MPRSQFFGVRFVVSTAYVFTGKSREPFRSWAMSGVCCFVRLSLGSPTGIDFKRFCTKLAAFAAAKACFTISGTNVS